MKNRRKITFIYLISHLKIIVCYASMLALAMMLALINPRPSFAAYEPRSHQPQEIDIAAIADEAAESLGWSERSSGNAEDGIVVSHWDEVGTCQEDDVVSPNTYTASIWIWAEGSPEEAEEKAITVGGGVTLESFHELNAYRAGDDAFSWAMANVVFSVSEVYDCLPDGQSHDVLPIAEAVYAAARRHGLSTEVPPTPDPYIDPDPYIEPGPYIDPNPEPYPYPDPDPVPGPITIDQETLEMLQSILSAPGLPITGAIAGGLVAWVLSMLGGGRTVLPPAPRPPTGGLRPGQAGPDGKIWSTGQGWVSKSTYDFQQKWVQKGWQLNSQTGKLEVQPGAINEKGQVWYKVPHAMDEGDSHNWVDKDKVQEIERNLAEGKVWDRALDWQTPKDLADYNAQRDKISSPEARQRDHERLMQQKVAPDPQYQKIANDIKQLHDILDGISRQIIQDDMDFNQRIAELHKLTLKRAEIVDGPLNSMKKAADTSIDILGGVPGMPTGIRYVYKAVTGFSDKAFTDRSLWSGMKGALEAVVKEKIGDKLGELVPTPGIKDLPEIGNRGIWDIIQSTGEDEIKQVGLNLAKGQALSPGVDYIYAGGKDIGTDIITGKKNLIDLLKDID